MRTEVSQLVGDLWVSARCLIDVGKQIRPLQTLNTVGSCQKQKFLVSVAKTHAMF